MLLYCIGTWNTFSGSRPDSETLGPVCKRAKVCPNKAEGKQGWAGCEEVSVSLTCKPSLTTTKCMVNHDLSKYESRPECLSFGTFRAENIIPWDRSTSPIKNAGKVLLQDGN